MKVNDLLATATQRQQYNQYYQLHKKYGNIDVNTELVVVENIKRLISGEKLKSDALITCSMYAENSLTIGQFIKNVRSVCNNHSIYVTILLLSMSSLSIKEIFSLKIGEIDNLEQKLNTTFPDWLKTVIKRQKLMAYNAKLDDNAPFIFCFRLDKSGNYTLVRAETRFARFCKDYKHQFGFTPLQHIKKIRFGLENGVMIQAIHTHNSLIGRYRMYIGHLVAIKDVNLNDLCDGISIGETEPGVHIILTADCKFIIAPIYTIVMYNEPVYPGRFDKFEKILSLFFDYEDFDRSKMKYWSDLPKFHFNKEKYLSWKQNEHN